MALPLDISLAIFIEQTPRILNRIVTRVLFQNFRNINIIKLDATIQEDVVKAVKMRTWQSSHE